MIQFLYFKNFEKYELRKIRVSVKNKTMNKTTLSPIIAGTMNWEFGIKPNIKEMLNMIHVCLENKITTFDHADIYGSYTTDFGKAFSSSKIAREKYSYPKWDSNAG
jgi:predicted oxidoreductase